MVAAPPPSPARAVYLSDGDELDYIPAADVVAGQIVVQNDLVGVVLHAAPAGERTALETFGLYAFPKPTGAGTAIPSGTKAYWDEANQWASAADGGGANKYIGKTAADATDDDLTVQIRMAQ